MTNEQIITNFLRTEYSDSDLAAALAHAQDGKLSYYSCCCLRGIPSANHALRGVINTGEQFGPATEHASHDPALFDLVRSDRYMEADEAYLQLGSPIDDDWQAADARRRARLIPLIEAEISRRESERASELQEVEDVVCA